MNDILTFYSIPILLLFFSCKEETSFDDKYRYSNYEITINDTLLTSAINEYVDFYKLNPETEYVNLNYGKEMSLISKGISDFRTRTDLPMHHTMINGFLVLIHSDIENLEKDAQNDREIYYTKLAESLGLNLDNREYSWHFPMWIYRSCGDNFELIKQAETDLKYFNLPCGYHLKFYGPKMDSLVLVKD